MCQPCYGMMEPWALCLDIKRPAWAREDCAAWGVQIALQLLDLLFQLERAVHWQILENSQQVYWVGLMLPHFPANPRNLKDPWKFEGPI